MVWVWLVSGEFGGLTFLYYCFLYVWWLMICVGLRLVVGFRVGFAYVMYLFCFVVSRLFAWRVWLVFCGCLG